ncbi:MAG: Peptidase [Candidatus Parcubacteria bacterium]|jgi:gamma-glutamyl-gamma-aminobutyrate hydrolase PuuD
MVTESTQLAQTEFDTATETYCGTPIEWATADDSGFMSMMDADGTKKSLMGMLDRKPAYTAASVVLAGAARPAEKPYTGHMTTYQQHLYPETAQLLFLPANRTFTDEEIVQLVQTTNLIGIFGGSHLGPEFMGPATPTYNAELDGGYDHDRDHNELIMLREAVRTEKPVIGICRGLQAGIAALITHIEDFQTVDDMANLEGLFTPAEPHHRPQHKGSILQHPLMNTLPDHMKKLCPWLEGYEPVSYHSLKIPYGYLQNHSKNGQSYEQELKALGWFVAAIDGTDGIELNQRAVEMLIHIDQTGDVDGYLTQYHPEKHTTLSSEEQQQWHDQHMWSAGIVNRVIAHTASTDL